MTSLNCMFVPTKICTFEKLEPANVLGGFFAKSSDLF